MHKRNTSTSATFGYVELHAFCLLYVPDNNRCQSGVTILSNNTRTWSAAKKVDNTNRKVERGGQSSTSRGPRIVLPLKGDYQLNYNKIVFELARALNTNWDEEKDPEKQPAREENV